MILMKIPTVTGQTEIDGHADWLPVDSISWSVSRPVATATAGRNKREAGTPSISEVQFSRMTDKASPHLFHNSCGGKELDSVEIEILQIVDNKPHVFVKIKLENVYVSSYSVSSGGDNPTETVSLNFVTLSYQYDTWAANNQMIPGNERKWNQAKVVGV